MMNLAIGYEYASDQLQAQQLAHQLNLKIDNEAKQQLRVIAGKLVLKIDAFSPLSADFTYLKWKPRLDAGKNQGLVKACKPYSGMRVIDATAGWGRDAAVLASFGAEVIMLERHPVMAALLLDALTHRDERSKTSLQLTLQITNTFDYLRVLPTDDYPDLIYIDPMHPARQKSALVKKDMQILHQLMGTEEEEAYALVQLAMTRVLKRVVIKWPQQQPSLGKPSFSYPGKTVRFDVYSPRN